MWLSARITARISFPARYVIEMSGKRQAPFDWSIDVTPARVISQSVWKVIGCVEISLGRLLSLY